MRRILYLTYDGLTDPLGQSQVLPYLVGLSQKGHKITIVSFEKPERTNDIPTLQESLDRVHINWRPLTYTKNPPILSTLFDLYKLKRTCKGLQKETKFDIVHCRSYVTSLTGLYLKSRFGLKFIFDMRGFWADERVDGGIWSLSNPIFRWVYNYFKRKEKEFLTNADQIISLTFKAEEIIQSWQLKSDKLPISVIPTCVDTDHFHPDSIKTDQLNALKSRLEFTGNDFVLSYLGSLGTWYLVKEMVHFFSVLKKQIPEARFLIITRDNPKQIFQFAEHYHLDRKDFTLVSASRDEVPYYISLSDWTIFFIKPVFSKSASAPTKMAEIINLNKPILFNLGVGDMDQFNEKYTIGYGIEQLNETSFQSAAEFIDSHRELEVENTLVEKYYSLEKAVEKLDGIYRELFVG
mgnify:CR=1 FL=1